MNLGSVWVRRRASFTAGNEVRCPCSSLFRGGQCHATYERLDGLADCARLNPDSSSSAHSFFIRRTLDQVFATVGLLSSHMVNEVAEAPLFPHVEPVLELLVSVQALLRAPKLITITVSWPRKKEKTKKTHSKPQPAGKAQGPKNRKAWARHC